LKQVYAFTGIAGTSVQQVVRHVSTSVSDNPLVICIDEYLWQEFSKDARKNSELLRLTGLEEAHVQEGKSPDWWHLLTLPIDGIRHYWRLAAKRALEEIQATASEVVLVTFHACYQSDHFRWRLSAVDPSLLKEFSFRAFFTLIDDIYDVHRRRLYDLRAERMVVGYDDQNWDRAAKLLQLTVYYLEQFILWRQEEIVLTDLFAATCKVPSHVFAIKHPIRTMVKLIHEPGTSSYFSHPITGVRQQQSFADTDDFKEIKNISGIIREQTTLIEPTTIDEFRIYQDKTSGIKKYLPSLSPRWPLLAKPSELVCAPLIGLSDPHEECVFSLANASELGLEEEFASLAAGSAPTKICDSISSSLEQLSAKIAEDITWRDHYLVDQTKGLIVYRPMQKGRLSIGVQRELEYYAKLRLTGAPTKGCIIYHPDEDQRIRASDVAKELLKTWTNYDEIASNLRPRLTSPNVDSRKLLSDLTEVVYMTADASSGGVKAVEVLERFVRIEPHISDSSPMSVGTTFNAIVRSDSIKELATAVAKSVIEREYYLDIMRTTPGLGLQFVVDESAIVDSLKRLAIQSPNKQEK
jgi:hypothetical protein